MVRTVVKLAARARALRIAGALSTLAVLCVGSVMAGAAVDAAVRFPAVLRGAMLVTLLVMAVLEVRRFVVPALRFRPQPVDLALRIERMRPELAGKLASAVEFELVGTSRGSVLAARAIHDAETRALGTSLRKVLRLKPMGMRVAAALLCVTAAITFAVFDTNSASIALRRMLMPWTDAVWPARTALAGLITDGSVAARGRPLALRAQLTQGEAQSERVRAQYRLTRHGEGSEWIEVGLARQPSGEFERLVDTDGDQLEVRFLTSDATTEVATVRLVAPPAISSAEARIDPPPYAAHAVAARVEPLGDCSGSSAILRDGVLVGSEVLFDLRLSRALPFDIAAIPLKTTTGTVVAQMTVDPTDAAHWMIHCAATEATRLSLTLTDADGITADDVVVLAFDVLTDRAPSATISEPLQDESIVSDARIPMRTDARDDIGLAQAGIEIATRLGKDSAESLVLDEPAVLAEGASDASIERVLDVSKLALKAGDSVALRAYAQDSFVPTAGQPVHERVRSAARVLRIVGDEEFERQLRGVFAGVRRDAMRVDERQGKARDALERDPTESGLAEMQGSVTEGAARMREAIEQTIARLERNGRDTSSLAELAEQARELAATAESRSAEASGAVERTQKEAEPAAKTEAAKEAAARQDAVRDELEDLVSLLDRDEDSWLAKRRLDALANKIRQSARETEQAAQRSGGESREELSPAARAEVDALADKQQQAATEAEQVVQELKERAESLKEAEPAQSRALEAAAKAAEDGKVREEMEKAAKDSEQNRLAQSKDAQDRALDALQKASNALDEDRKVRAEELARQLESLVDSIKRLIKEAELLKDEVAAVDEEVDQAGTRERAGLGAGKLSQNTRGVATDARATGREAARVARTLDAAAGSLAKVAGNLRSDPFDRNDTTLAMDGALKSLQDALTEAEEATQRAEERATEEKREELLAKYRGFLERQAALRGSVAKIVPAQLAPLGRREMIESRRLGIVQEELRKAIAAVREEEADVRDSDALVEMHDAIDAALIDAKDGLSGGRPTDAMPGEDEAVEALSAIVGALDEGAAPKDEDPFGEQEGEQGGESGGEGGEQPGAVPPEAEIRLLRAMQESLAKRTRSFAELSESLGPVTSAQRLAEIAMRQQRVLDLATKLAEKLAPRKSPATMKPSTGPEEAPPVPPSGEWSPQPRQKRLDLQGAQR